MSETIATTSSESSMQKRTCTKCHRTVLLAPIDGKIVETDPDLMQTVTIDSRARGTKATGLAQSRRVHAETCITYQLDNERKASRAKWAGPPTKKAAEARGRRK